MGIRFGSTAAAVLLLGATGCGPHPHTQPLPAQAPTLGPSPLEQPFDEVDPGARRTARAFVTTALMYDSRRESANAFLKRLNDLVTPAEQERLRVSGRASLNWSAMQARRERSSMQVTGVSATGKAGMSLACVVTAIRRTTSSIATTEDFVSIHLTLLWTPTGWVVSASEGGGL